jgi:hypothetical protein
MQGLIVNDFLPFPTQVRAWALSQNFYNAKQFTEKYNHYTNWPGVRTDHVMELDGAYADFVLSRIVNLAMMNFGGKNYSVKSFFQVHGENDGDSWVHQDNDVDVAGLIYLSPDAPVTSGTTLYRCNDHSRWINLHIDDMTKINRQERKDLYDEIFEPVDIIGNVFNRMVMYRGDIFHKSNDYFGKTLQDSRLTQVFFLTAEK